MISWIDIVFAISIGLFVLSVLSVFIKWMFRGLEHKKIRKHLRHIESLNKEKENKDE